MLGSIESSEPHRFRAPHVVAWMVLAIALLGTVLYLDEKRATREALADFGDEQAMVAHAAAVSLPDLRGASEEDALHEIARHVKALERPGQMLVLVARPNGALASLDGSSIASAPIEDLVVQRGRQAWVQLTHEEAVALGLPPRTAIAGMADITRAGGETWGIVVVASASRERDREERGLLRVSLGFFLTSAIVIAFGLFALRTQRRQLDLARQLAVSEAVRTRDERLVRADKLATLGALATGIGHQVATPLGVIVNRAERLKSRVEGDEKAHRAVVAIAEQANRIGDIVRAFLSVVGGRAPEMRRTDAAALARSVHDLVGHRFDQAGVSLAVDVADETPSIDCDVRLFEQALVNLVLNACDACDRGGAVRLGVRAEEGDVLFAVDDDGTGMSRAEIERATEPFFTTKPFGEGTGLGLTIAREIVNQHRGTLALERTERGMRATVRVPAAPDEASS